MKELIMLQGAVLLYSLNTVCGKCASMQTPLSLPFFCWLGAEVILLGMYAVVWQQAIKRIDLSVAYANKAAGLIWSLLFSALLFGDRVTMQKIAALTLIIAGCVLMNLPDRTGEETVSAEDMYDETVDTSPVSVGDAATLSSRRGLTQEVRHV